MQWLGRTVTAVTNVARVVSRKVGELFFPELLVFLSLFVNRLIQYANFKKYKSELATQVGR
jgi:hypothetical protein